MRFTVFPTYAAAHGGLLSDCYPVNEFVASAAVVDADGQQLTAIAFAAEQYRHLLSQAQMGRLVTTSLFCAVFIFSLTLSDRPGSR